MRAELNWAISHLLAPGYLAACTVCLPMQSPDYCAASIPLKGVAMEMHSDGSLMWRLWAGETDSSLWRAAEEWGGLALANVYVCFIFSLPLPHPLPRSLVLPFSLSCLDSYSLFHANILECSSSLLLCTPICVFGLAPCTFSFWKIKQIKTENLRRRPASTTLLKRNDWGKSSFRSGNHTYQS